MSYSYGPDRKTPNGKARDKRFNPFDKKQQQRNGYHNNNNGRNSSSFSSFNKNYQNNNYQNNRFNKKNKNGMSNSFGIKSGQQGASLVPIDWSSMELKPFKKDFYSESSKTKKLTLQQVNDWRIENRVKCRSGFQQIMKVKNGKKSIYSKQNDDENENENGNCNDWVNYDGWNKKFYSDDDDEENDVDNNNNNNNNNNSSLDELDGKKQNEIIPIPKPILNFTDANFPDDILNKIKKVGFEKPTPIQSQAWPMIMKGNNVIGIASTGSGKTVAFLLPGLLQIKHIQSQTKRFRGCGPIMLVIAPTRELAIQIEKEVGLFINSEKIKHVCVYGGVKRGPQKYALKRGVEICIATPGRLLDFIESKVTDLTRWCSYVVIDEADRLLDMGFEPQLLAILNQIRPDRQIMMFSATWPVEVRTLANKLLGIKSNAHLLQVSIGSKNINQLHANENVKQIIHIMDKFNKIKNLKNILNEYMEENDKTKILVFISTKKMCNKLCDILWEDGYYVTAIHGDKEQTSRETALNNFKSGKYNILLATDVASRGLHIDNIELVINFDFPSHIEDYVHRIGRTGRVDNKGTAISFFVQDDDGHRAKGLIKILKSSNQDIPQELVKISEQNPKKKKRFGAYNRHRYYNNKRF